MVVNFGRSTRPAEVGECRAVHRARGQNRPAKFPVKGPAYCWLLLATDLASRVNHPLDNIVQYTEKRDLVAFTNFFRALQCFEQMQGQKAMPQPRALPRPLRGARGGQHHTASTTNLGHLALDGLKNTRDTFHLPRLGTHAARTGAIRDDQEPAARNSAAP